ncbi:hypothetical protein PTTG_25999 [Puccinia triticina 1-1 BBBD Race 1]|uniref:Uncharacterized protein n=1 Tax=Puccinia triticina (isolate 1-1 / race 1 (BBBD)) TaxID=630390 RepID=A0A180GYI1_PUCT1|nr:hypothetical protein PTTG_25999 [Puccinia triticina 1-1 BBBD Race 1]WAR61447.1 hypothetical protein PtB15_12B132 [Puccinia triticina]
MRAASYSTLSAYHTFNSLILVLLGLIIAQCLCFPTLGEILETHPDDLPEFEKRLKSEMWQNSFSSVQELGRSICGERAGSHGGQSHNHKGPEATALFLSALQNDVLNPIQIYSAPESIGFTAEVAKDLDNEISNLSRLVKSLMEKVSMSANQPPDLEESAGTGLLGNAEDGDLAASDFLKGTKKIVEILQTSKSIHFRPDQQILAALRERMALDHLNEALVKFLIILERRNLASPKWLENLLKKKEGVVITFNYLARRFPGLRDNIDIPNAYLITDFKKAVQESPFTAELQGLFKHFGLYEWHWLERLRLKYQVSALDLRFDKVAAKFERLTSPYFLQNHVGNSPYDQDVKYLLSLLAKQIGDISKSSGKISISSPPIMEILSLKILHSMVRFLGRYHIHWGWWADVEVKIPDSSWSTKDAEQFRELDGLIMLLSDQIKSVYFQYGQSTQKIISFWLLDNSIAMVYLSDINKSAQPAKYELVAETIFHYRKYPLLPYFKPMINNIVEGLRATQNREARVRLDELKLIFLKPEELYTLT